MNPRKLTIIESPFSSANGRSEDENLQYLRKCLRDSWSRGELPFASHGFFPLFLRESDPEERKLGIEAGYQFWDFVNFSATTISQKPHIAFYCDYGISSGMKLALDRALELGRDHEIRYLLGASDATRLAATEQGSTS